MTYPINGSNMPSEAFSKKQHKVLNGVSKRLLKGALDTKTGHIRTFPSAMEYFKAFRIFPGIKKSCRFVIPCYNGVKPVGETSPRGAGCGATERTRRANAHMAEAAGRMSYSITAAALRTAEVRKLHRCA